jgi:hypothetical protein
VLLASFLGYDSRPAQRVIDFGQIEQAFGTAVSEMALPPEIRESLAQMKADPRYIELIQQRNGGTP